jgi:hypothetical protein
MSIADCLCGYDCRKSEDIEGQMLFDFMDDYFMCEADKTQYDNADLNQMFNLLSKAAQYDAVSHFRYVYEELGIGESSVFNGYIFEVASDYNATRTMQYIIDRGSCVLGPSYKPLVNLIWYDNLTVFKELTEKFDIPESVSSRFNQFSGYENAVKIRTYLKGIDDAI